jgi:hypothetical protein
MIVEIRLWIRATYPVEHTTAPWSLEQVQAREVDNPVAFWINIRPSPRTPALTTLILSAGKKSHCLPPGPALNLTTQPRNDFIVSRM